MKSLVCSKMIKFNFSVTGQNANRLHIQFFKKASVSGTWCKVSGDQSGSEAY